MGLTPSARATRILAGLLSATTVLALTVRPTTSAGAAQVDVVSDVRYATHEGIELLLDIYEPVGEGPFPAVIVIPGGRWVNIDKTKHADVPTYFAEHGIAAFAITYRSALEFPYPAAVQDVMAAVRWVRRNAHSYEVDPHQLGAVGVSAGGHLAAMLGAMGSGPTDEGARVDVVLSWSGPMDLERLVDAEDVEVREAVQAFLGCSGGDACAETAREASPITYVDPSDPPMVLINGDEDIIPSDQAERMGQALTDAGVQAEVMIVQGGHGAGYGGGEKVLDLVIPFAQAWIAGRDVPSAIQGDGGEADAEGEKDVAGEDVAGEAASSPSSKEETGTSRPSDIERETTSSQDRVLVAVALVALIVIIVQVFVIVGLRRRIVSRSRSAGSAGAETP